MFHLCQNKNSHFVCVYVTDILFVRYCVNWNNETKWTLRDEWFTCVMIGKTGKMLEFVTILQTNVQTSSLFEMSDETFLQRLDNGTIRVLFL